MPTAYALEKHIPAPQEPSPAPGTQMRRRVLPLLPREREPNLAIRFRRFGDGNSGAELQPLFGHLRRPAPPMPYRPFAPCQRAGRPAF